MNTEIRRILESVRDGSLSVDDAVLKIKQEPFTDLGYAMVDHHRKIRQGAAEVIYGAGKTAEQISGIAKVLKEKGNDSNLYSLLRFCLGNAGADVSRLGLQLQQVGGGALATYCK